MTADWQELRAQYGHLIDQFGQGWESAKADAIAELFTEDAVFKPSPFDAEVTGRSAIIAYWKEVPFEQAEVAFRSGEVFVAGPWFGTEFRCTFRRRRTGERVDVRGALFCETVDGKIAEMRMYWHRETGRA